MRYKIQRKGIIWCEMSIEASSEEEALKAADIDINDWSHSYEVVETFTWSDSPLWIAKVSE